MTKYISGLSHIDAPYDGLVVDLWGVMHNGKALFEPAVEALKTARAEGKSITLLSNAPRRRGIALDGLTGRLGLNPDLFDDLITSGEVAWQWILEGGPAAWGNQVYFFGAGKDRDMMNGLDKLDFVETPEQADWILNVGPEAGQEDLAPFQTLIDSGLEKRLPMVCANPDLIVMRGTKAELCAGAIAKAYEDQGGEVHWFGKPHARVYEAVFESCGLPPERLLGVGDSFKTDIRGANVHGLLSLFVGTGIHGAEVGQPLDMGKVQELAEQNQAIPTYSADRFAA